LVVFKPPPGEFSLIEDGICACISAFHSVPSISLFLSLSLSLSISIRQNDPFLTSFLLFFPLQQRARALTSFLLFFSFSLAIHLPIPTPYQLLQGSFLYAAIYTSFLDEFVCAAAVLDLLNGASKYGKWRLMQKLSSLRPVGGRGSFTAWIFRRSPSFDLVRAFSLQFGFRI
jgi:hypothetical protein